MKRSARRAPVVCAALLIGACATTPPAPPAPPPQIGGFVTRIGDDTLQIERFARTRNTITGRTLARSPATVVRDYNFQYRADGTIARLEVLTRAADLTSDSVRGRAVATFLNDTAFVETGVGPAARTQWIPAAAPDVAFVGGLAYAQFEYAAQRTPAAVGDSAVLRVYFPPALGGVQPFVLRRVATDTVTMWAAPMGTVRVAFDSLGRAIAFDGIGSSLNYHATRLGEIDIDSVARAFAARDAGGGLGPISPRDTLLATVHGAQFTVEYGRPSVRSRQIFGAVVPWGRVWRVGANQATHFRTNRDVVIGGLTVPAGLYTLWVVPSEDGRWQLIVNRQTGQWGTIYDRAQDLGRVPLTVTRLSEPVEQLTINIEPRQVGGVLVIRWDTYEASVPLSPR